VACDFDGTLAPIVDDPATAVPHRAALAALLLLADLPRTVVVVISGRSRDDLEDRIGEHGAVGLVGSHGAEGPNTGLVLTPAEHEQLEMLCEQLEELAARFPGAFVEVKPLSVAFHVRRVGVDDEEAALGLALERAAALPEVFVKLGKKVAEFLLVETDKGTAIELARRASGATTCVFLGDDVTDEAGFAALGECDVGVKVGAEATLAEHSVDHVDDVAAILAELASLRTGVIGEAPFELIERHSLLSDLEALALVQSDGRITWMGAPSADSPALFSQLLGTEAHGYFDISPIGAVGTPVQSYEPETMILVTRWPGLSVTDCLTLSDLPTPGSVLLRRVEGTDPAHVRFVPRPDYARATAEVTCGGETATLSTDVADLRLSVRGGSFEVEDGPGGLMVVATLDPSSGPIDVVLEMAPAGELAPTPSDLGAELETTRAWWRAWSAKLELPSVATESVRRSALILKSLCHRSTGTIMAAATTSLPEDIRGTRNWDYRMCWPRDGSMAATALVRLGMVEEAEQFIAWMSLRVSELGGPEEMRPVYPLRGDRGIPEEEIPSLPGYRGSAPVRIGNGADEQVQMDVFGPIVALIDAMVERDCELTEEIWWLVSQMVEAVSRRWDQPDHGIWEERRPIRHHVHSKVMCWETVDRAISLAKRSGRPLGDGWLDLREKIRDDVLAQGWDPDVGAFTMAYGEGDLDAAVLHLGISGLLDPHDERFVSTVEKIESALRVGPTVYRYAIDDGFRESEGGFFICAAWLAQSYWRIGRIEEGTKLFEDYLALEGPTGLIAEQYDPYLRVALGNVPQAYSHIGLIDLALTVESRGIYLR